MQVVQVIFQLHFRCQVQVVQGVFLIQKRIKTDLTDDCHAQPIREIRAIRCWEKVICIRVYGLMGLTGQSFESFKSVDNLGCVPVILA